MLTTVLAAKQSNEKTLLASEGSLLEVYFWFLC